ncbi:hypothetical protein E2H86_20560 [Pseudomonas putida]|nr:hypothetical protein E2H86_20560 [Pseudomonas putida]
MGFLTSAGRYAAFWRCPRAGCKARQDFILQPHVPDTSKFFAISNATFRSCLNSKLRGWVKSFPAWQPSCQTTLTLG